MDLRKLTKDKIILWERCEQKMETKTSFSLHSSPDPTSPPGKQLIWYTIVKLIKNKK